MLNSSYLVARRALSQSRHMRVSSFPLAAVASSPLLHPVNPLAKTPSRTNTQHRVILLPEHPAQTPATNPCLKHYKEGFPDLKNIGEKDCYYGLGQILMEFESAVCGMEDMIEAGETDWEILMKQMEEQRLSLESVWNTVNLLNIATDQLDMDRFNQLILRADRAFLTRFGSRTIFSFIAGDKVSGVSGEEARILERYLLEYKLQGYELPDKKYKELNSFWTKKLIEAQRDCRFRVTTASQRFRHVVRDPSVVREFPVDLLRAMSADSSQPAKGPWSVTLHPYVYRKFLQYCPDRRLRWNAFTAHRSRGSASMDVYLNVSGYVKDIRESRQGQAHTLGYYNYAEMAMVTKMAGSIDNVNSMISSLLGPAKAAQQEEITSLQEYAESRGFDDTIREFDVPFFKRKQARTVFGVDEEALRDYFPLPTVLRGMFQLLDQHFGLKFTEMEDMTGISVWHPDVTVYRVTDGDKELGHLCLDPYKRDDKAYQGGDCGWYLPIRSASTVGGGQPLGALVMAFSSPGYGKPSLLSFPEVEELMRKLGKVAVHMLGQRKWAETSGLMGLERDALNLVPDLLSHWLGVPAVVASISGHWSTGESLSDSQVLSLVASRNHMAGYDLCQKLYKAAFDIAFYSEDYENEQYQTLAARLAPQYLVLDREKEDAFPLYFQEITTGDWASGYYSHTWCKMLAADIFAAYMEAGLDNQQEIQKVSARFKKTFLTSGSALHPAPLFREFRGRDPTPEALLISLGLKSSPPPKARSMKN